MPSLCAEQEIVVTVGAPPGPLPAQGTPYFSLAQRVDARSLAAGGSTFGYMTPTYVTVNTPRGLSLMYSSEVAESRTTVEVDAIVRSQETPSRVSLEVLTPGTGVVVSAAYFLGDTGAMRLATRFTSVCSGGTPVCATPYDVRVSAYYSGGVVKQQTWPGVRVLAHVSTNSNYGRGWMLPGASRLIAQADGVVLWDGAGGIAFFAKTSCTGSGPSESCEYSSPQGDFTTLARRPAHASYGTRYFRANRAGDTTYFDDAGLLLRTKARYGKLQTTVAWITDALGVRVASITDPMNRTMTLQYEAAQGGAGFRPGSLRYIDLPDGRRVSVQVENATGNLVRIDGPDGVMDLSAAYAVGTNRLTSYTERVGGGSFGYDELGLLAVSKGLGVAFEEGTGADSVLIFTALGSALARGQATSAAANRTPLQSALAADSTVNTSGAVSKVWWNASRLPARLLTRGAAGDSVVASTTYNLNLQPLVVEMSGRAPVSYGYTGFPVPLLTSVTQGALGETTSYTYGPFDQLKTVHVNGIKMREAFFASATALTPDSVKSDTANTVRQKVDAYGRVRSTRDARQVFDTVTVEATHGNTSTTTLSAPGVANRVETYGYDNAGRVTQVIDHLARVSRVAYDSRGLVSAAIGLATSQSPDTVLYTQNDVTRTYTMRDPVGNLHTELRNTIGLTTSSTDPRGQLTSYGYDRAGRIVRSTDRRGVVVRDSLDLLGRLVRRVAGSDTTWFAHDPNKRWVATRNAESIDTTFVDAAGRPTLAVTVRGAVRYALSQGWVGSLPDGVTIQSFLTPAGAPAWTRSTGSGYDGMQREKAIQDFGGGMTTTTFDSRGMEKSIALPSYTTTRTNTIGALGELQRAAYSGSAAAFTRFYQYDQSTRIAQIARGIATDSTKRIHNYDSRDRLSDYRDVRTWVETVWEPWDPYGDCPGCMIQNDITHVDTLRSALYTFDKIGNPTGAGITLQPDGGNRLATVLGESFSYDAEGNLLQRWGGPAGATTYTWNALGQLAQVVSPQATTTYGYDGWGRRVRKTVNGVVTRYLVQDDQVVMELDASNGIMAEYTYYPGTDRPHGMRRGGAQYFYAQDAQGNVTGLMNPNGSVVETYEYTPQGAMIGSGGSVGNPYRWKGREWDAEAGLYYVRARYYDPVVGRFVSEDPIGTAGGPNPYAFAAGDPVNFSDPSGLFPGECPVALLSIGYASIVVGRDGSGRPIYSCWYIRLPPVVVTASVDPARGGSPYRSRGGSAMDYMNGGTTIPFGDDFGGEAPRPLMSLCAASSLAFATGVVSDLYLFKGMLKGAAYGLKGTWHALAGNGSAKTLFQSNITILRQQTRFGRGAFFAGEMAAADALATYGVVDGMQVSAVAALSGSQPTIRDFTPVLSTIDAGTLVGASCPGW